MKSKERQILKLEAELLKLNSLVRARRETVARLATCPNKGCECRLLWQEHTEKNLARQVGKVRTRVTNGTAKPAPGRKAKTTKPAKIAKKR